VRLIPRQISRTDSVQDQETKRAAEAYNGCRAIEDGDNKSKAIPVIGLGGV
jgi:hypothetical protein